MDYADGTSLVLEPGPFGCGFVGGKALCSDGKVRTLHPTYDGIADTFFSIPMFVYVGKVRVYGFAMINTKGYDESSYFIEFCAYQYRKHGGLLP